MSGTACEWNVVFLLDDRGQLCGQVKSSLFDVSTEKKLLGASSLFKWKSIFCVRTLLRFECETSIHLSNLVSLLGVWSFTQHRILPLWET